MSSYEVFHYFKQERKNDNGLKSLFDLEMEMIFDFCHSSGNEDIFKIELNKSVKYGKILDDKAFKNRRAKPLETTAFDFTEDNHSKTSI